MTKILLIIDYAPQYDHHVKAWRTYHLSQIIGDMHALRMRMV